MDQEQVLFGTPAMSAIFSSEAHVGALLAFEAGLARAQARAGVIPTDAAAAIDAACQVERFDVAALYRDAASAGTLAIPLVKALTAQVGSEAGRYVHWGATSQDAIDSALMLQMRRGLDILHHDLLEIGASLATMADQQRRTLMIGRTLSQQALPITFGLKAARWLALVVRQVRALTRLQSESLVVQYGGAVGTLAALGEHGLTVVELLAEELGLGIPDLPWHTERDRVVGVATGVALVAGAMLKIAGDVVLLTQTEVGEVAEASVIGKGGSSAMPHKRNPVDATFAIASARLAIGALPTALNAMAQEHERGVGGWHLEWSILPSIFSHTAGAVARVRQMIEGLVIYPERMRANLELTGGLTMAEPLTVALAQTLGRPDAFALVESVVAHARETGQPLREVALANAQVRSILTPEQIDTALNPAACPGSADRFIERALAGYAALTVPTPPLHDPE